MSKDIIVIIGYIIIVALLCVIWNKFMMRQYNFNNTQSSLVHNAIMRCSVHIDQMTDLTLAGNGPDQTMITNLLTLSKGFLYQIIQG